MDQELKAKIIAIHSEYRGVYGSPRMHRELAARGIGVSKKRVERLMKEAGLSGKVPRRHIRTTDSNHHLPIAQDLIQQDFTADAPDRRWVADITYIPTDEGWLYLSAIEDLFSRRIVGWAMEETMTTSLVQKALRMAIANRHPGPGLIHHSDRGSQYASMAYRLDLSEHGIRSSMSRKANCYDNAVMESFWHSLKNELTHRMKFATRAQARQAIFDYIEVFYNQIRRHSTLDYMSPEAFERAHASTGAA